MNSLLDLVYLDLEDFACNQITDDCFNKERTISYALRVTRPDEIINSDIKHKECCYESLVLADGTGKLHRNDFNGFWSTRQLPNETVVFVLVDKSDNSEYELNNADYGIYKPFGSYTEQTNLTTFIVDWSKVLADLGEGSYQVRKDVTVTGISYSELSPVYTLKTYSDLLADKTIRLDVNMNGLLEHLNVNFKGTSYKTSLRIGGFFGRREPKHEQDNIIFRNKKVEQITMKQLNEYQFQTELLPECVTVQIFDFLLFADEMFINDYNLNNHSYSFKNKAIVLEKNNGTKYYTENRRARINLIFSDRFVNRNKLNY